MNTTKRERVVASQEKRAAIFHYRMLHNISQVEMAERLGIDAVTLWRYENFKSCPRGKTRTAIAKLLQKTAGQILDEYEQGRES